MHSHFSWGKNNEGNGCNKRKERNWAGLGVFAVKAEPLTVLLLYSTKTNPDPFGVLSPALERMQMRTHIRQHKMNKYIQKHTTNEDREHSISPNVFPAP